MELTVKYFAGLRERFGISEEAVELDGANTVTVADLWEALEQLHPELEQMRGFVRVAVNRDFAGPDTRLSPNDEVALIPPVSGGSGDQPTALAELEDDTGRFRITADTLDTDGIRSHVTRPGAGAIVLFEGVVRDHTGDRDVTHLEYECYVEMALEKLIQTAAEVDERWEPTRIAIHHRYGRLDIGEKAVVIAVSSPHRAAAFEACQYAIDRLKEIVPIWKKEVGPNGDEWIGMGP